MRLRPKMCEKNRCFCKKLTRFTDDSTGMGRLSQGSPGQIRVILVCSFCILSEKSAHRDYYSGSSSDRLLLMFYAELALCSVGEMHNCIM